MKKFTKRSLLMLLLSLLSLAGAIYVLILWLS